MFKPVTDCDSSLHFRCDHRSQRRRWHRPRRLYHQEAKARSSRVGQTGHDLQRRLAALLLHALHRGLREHQPGRDQHPLHHRVRMGPEISPAETWWENVHLSLFLFPVHRPTLTMTQRNLTGGCNVNCGCKIHEYAPVCGSDGITYFNPCLAGCSSVSNDSTGVSEGERGRRQPIRVAARPDIHPHFFLPSPLRSVTTQTAPVSKVGRSSRRRPPEAREGTSCSLSS